MSTDGTSPVRRPARRVRQPVPGTQPTEPPNRRLTEEHINTVIPLPGAASAHAGPEPTARHRHARTGSAPTWKRTLAAFAAGAAVNEATVLTGQHTLVRTGGGHLHAPWFIPELMTMFAGHYSPRPGAGNRQPPRGDTDRSWHEEED